MLEIKYLLFKAILFNASQGDVPSVEVISKKLKTISKHIKEGENMSLKIGFIWRMVIACRGSI